MMNRLFFSFALLFLLSAAEAVGRTGAKSEGALGGVPEPSLDEIVLLDGSIIQGHIVDEDDTTIVIETESLGTLQIDRDRIKEIRLSEKRWDGRSDPDYNSVMFCPTPATLPSGGMYFRDYEFLFLNYGASLANGFDLSLGTLFPITGEIMALSIGAKIRLRDRERHPFGAALLGNYTWLDDDVRFGFVGFVAGVGDKDRSFNFSYNRGFNDNGGSDDIFLLAADTRISRRIKLLGEYGNSANLLDSEDFTGFLNLGFRVFGERMAFTVSGLYPLFTDEDFFLAPIGMISAHW